MFQKKLGKFENQGSESLESILKASYDASTR